MVFFYPYVFPDLYPSVVDFMMMPLAIYLYKRNNGKALLWISVIMTYFHLVFLAVGAILLARLKDEENLKFLIILSFPLLLFFGWHSPDYIIFYSQFDSVGNLPFLVVRILYPLGYLGVLLFIYERGGKD
jgi:hypothetical protein